MSNYHCNATHPGYDGKIQCNREPGHPGEHCRQKLDFTGYHNIWWTVTPPLPPATPAPGAAND